VSNNSINATVQNLASLVHNSLFVIDVLGYLHSLLISASILLVMYRAWLGLKALAWAWLW